MFNNIMRIKVIENYIFVLFLVSTLYVITINPNNLIPFVLYFALFYIPINLMVIYQNKKDMPDFELAHRLMFIALGAVPLLSAISQPITNLLRFH